jgi:hypothetical protein
MSEENVEIARRIVVAFRNAGHEAPVELAELTHPDIERTRRGCRFRDSTAFGEARKKWLAFGLAGVTPGRRMARSRTRS